MASLWVWKYASKKVYNRKYKISPGENIKRRAMTEGVYFQRPPPMGLSP